MADIYRKYDSKTNEWADFGDLKARQDLGFVEDTDVATHTIAAGQYVIWKGNLYTANSAITPDTALSSSNLTRVQNNGVDIGGLNSLKSIFDSHVNNCYSIDTYPNVSLNPGDAIVATKTLSKGVYIVEGKYYIESSDVRHIITINAGSIQHRLSMYDTKGWVFGDITVPVLVANASLNVTLGVFLSDKAETIKGITIIAVKIA